MDDARRSPTVPLVIAARLLSVAYTAVAVLFVAGAVRNVGAAAPALQVSTGLGIALGFGGLAVATFVVHPLAMRVSVWLCVCWLIMAPFACFPLFPDDLANPGTVPGQLWRFALAALPPLGFLTVVATDHAQQTRRATITASSPVPSR